MKYIFVALALISFLGASRPASAFGRIGQQSFVGCDGYNYQQQQPPPQQQQYQPPQQQQYQPPQQIYLQQKTKSLPI